MIEAPEIVDVPEQETAVIRLTIPREDIQRVMGPGIQELMDAVGAQGVGPTGAWFTHHLRMSPKTFDFEIGVPVSAPVKPRGRVKPGRLPAAKVARSLYAGGYEGLGAAWGELDAWVAAAGHTPAPDLWERYLVGPESGPDAALYRTELNRPLSA